MFTLDFFDTSLVNCNNLESLNSLYLFYSMFAVDKKLDLNIKVAECNYYSLIDCFNKIIILSIIVRDGLYKFNKGLCYRTDADDIS
jgi:hypothetical protein